MTRPRSATLLRVACVATLFALALMVWSVLAPTPVSVIVAMSAGQAIGTLSLLVYLAVVLTDLRRSKVLDPEPPRPSIPPSDPA